MWRRRYRLLPLDLLLIYSHQQLHPIFKHLRELFAEKPVSSAQNLHTRSFHLLQSGLSVTCWRHGQGIFVQQPSVVLAIEAQALRPLVGSQDTILRCQIGNKTHRTYTMKHGRHSVGNIAKETKLSQPSQQSMYCSIDTSLTIPCMLLKTGHSTCKYCFLHPIHSHSRPSYFADVWCQDKQRQRSHASTVAYRFSLYSELHPQIFFFPSASLGILQLSLLLSFVFSFHSLDRVLWWHTLQLFSKPEVNPSAANNAVSFFQKVRKIFFFSQPQTPGDDYIIDMQRHSSIRRSMLNLSYF